MAIESCKLCFGQEEWVSWFTCRNSGSQQRREWRPLPCNELPKEITQKVCSFMPGRRLHRHVGDDDIIIPEYVWLYFLPPGIHATHMKVQRFMIQFQSGLRAENLRRDIAIRRTFRHMAQAGVPGRASGGARSQQGILASMLPAEDSWGLDLDYISIPILPQVLTLFADWWQVGGTSTRSGKGLPDGLEVANAPCTLRIQVATRKRSSNKLQKLSFRRCRKTNRCIPF